MAEIKREGMDISGPFLSVFLEAAEHPGPSHFCGGPSELSPDGEAFLALAKAGANLNDLPKDP